MFQPRDVWRDELSTYFYYVYMYMYIHIYITTQYFAVISSQWSYCMTCTLYLHGSGVNADYEHSLLIGIYLLPGNGDILMSPPYKIVFIRQCQVQVAVPELEFPALIGFLLWAMCWTVRLVPTCFWRMGYCRVVRHTAHSSVWRGGIS